MSLGQAGEIGLEVVVADSTRQAPPRTLTVAVVARRLGVAPATLRTWARRYDLGPSLHTAGSHRRYTSADFARLVVMRRLTHEGVSPSEAAQAALSTPLESLDDVGVNEVALLDRRASDEASSEQTVRALGRLMPIQDSRRVARGLNRAALTMDARGVAQLIQRHITAAGVVATWDDVMVPVLENIGRRWETTGEGVEIEHLFSEAAIATMAAISSRLEQPRNTAQVLLSCAEDEQHSLPLHAVAAGLAERGVSARQLGARVPLEALAAAVRRTGPAVTLLYAAMPVPETALGEVLRRTRPNSRILLGGPGWGTPALPPYAEVVDSLGRAVSRICDIVAA
jgi:DNA-binding transcriptional MerR regulator